jgi:hypothetical protein
MTTGLAQVPSTVGDSLLIKATTSGIVFLKDGRYRSRYTGNKFSAVDINGNLWLRAAELKKKIKGGVLRPKKKEARVETQADNKFVQIDSPQISEKFSTSEGENLPLINNPSTIPARQYFVNKKEVRQRILGYINTYRGKKELYFWTVTFPKGTTDEAAYKAYNHWLTELRKFRMLKNYIWVAERQEIGTVHFHIAIPHKMPVQRANRMMAGILKGYSKRGEIPASVYACNRYNGVDIAKNKNTKRVVNFAVKKGQKALVGYLTKYITKNNTPFNHLAWHNSRGYSSIFTGVTFTIAEFKKNGLYSRLDASKKLEGEFFVFVPWWGEPPQKLMQHLYELNSFLQSQLN